MTEDGSPDIIVVKNSAWKFVLLSLLATVFVLGGIPIVYTAKDLKTYFIGWCCIIFFGFGLFVFLRQLFDKRPRIVIDDEGIFDRTLGVGRIDWQDIEMAYPNSIMTNHFISLLLKNPEKYLARISSNQRKLARWNEHLGFQKININLTGVDVSRDRILKIMIKNIVANSIKDIKLSSDE